MMANKTIQENDFFPFGEEVFLSATPMTDEEFTSYIVIGNDEIPIEEVDFSL